VFKKIRIMKVCLLTILSAFAFLNAFSAHAQSYEIEGIRIEGQTKVANTELKLNGTGIFRKGLFKVYVASLYLSDKKDNFEDIVALSAPKQIRLVTMRVSTAEHFATMLNDGLQRNLTRAEKAQLENSIQQFAALLASLPELNKGDIITIESLPKLGLILTVNGKRVAGEVADPTFFNAVLKIWLGEQPAYAPLKNQLLGVRPPAAN